MPQHASAKKRMRTNERDRRRNRAVKSQVRRVVKDLNAAMAEGNTAGPMNEAQSVLDKASKKGVLHKRHVDRVKSRLAKAAARAATQG